MNSKTLGGLLLTGALLVGAPAAWALGSPAPHASVDGSGQVHAEVQMPQPPQRPAVDTPDVEAPSVEAPATPDSAALSAQAQASAKHAGTRVLNKAEATNCPTVTTISPKPVDPTPGEITPVPVPSSGSNDGADASGSISVSASGEGHASLGR